MGQLPSILDIVRETETVKRQLNTILEPTAADKSSRHLLVTETRLPGLDTWRLSVAAGIALERHTVRCNFFRVNTAAIPARVFQYDVQVFPFDRETNAFSGVNCAGTEDDRILLLLFKALISKHLPSSASSASSSAGAAAGSVWPLLVFDGRSLAYSTEEVPLGVSSASSSSSSASASASSHTQQHQEVVALLNSDGAPSRKRFLVQLTRTAVVAVNVASNDPVVMAALNTSLVWFARTELADDHPTWLLTNAKVRSDECCVVLCCVVLLELVD